MTPLRILMNGARGRMGQAIVACASADSELAVVALIDEGDDFGAALPAADAIIDFSYHTVTPGVAEACAREKKLLVIGTTGHNAAEIDKIRAASALIPIVFAPNFSVGVNTLF